MTAQHLTGPVTLVGSGTHPAARTSPYDCHVFLLDGGSETALVDCGTGLETDRLLAHVEEVASLDRLTHIFVTHYHADHAGGAAGLRRRSNARVIASTRTATALATGDEEITQVAAARRAGIYPPDYHYPSCTVDTIAAEGTRCSVGNLEVTAHASPGHCDGHLCFLVDDGDRRALCTGDSVFHGGRVSIQPIPDCRPYEYARTAARLAELSVDVLLPGHLDFALTGGAAHLRTAAESFARLVTPPGIFHP